MHLKQIQMPGHVIVTVLVSLSLCSCANLDTRGGEDAIMPDKAFISSKRQEPNDIDLSKKNVSEKGLLSAGHSDISIEDAILLALDNNQSFHMERLNPRIQKTFEMEERAAFDPTLSLGYSRSRESKQTGGTSASKTEQTDATVEISQVFPTGTDLTLEVSTDSIEPYALGEQRSTRGGISITQALLRGYGLDVNLATLEQARIDTLVSEFELRGFAESLVADVEKTCWDYIFAQRRIAIFEDSLKLAEDQLLETQERIKIGKLAEVELYAAKAEVALRREALINARSDLALTRLSLLRLLSRPDGNQWNNDISIVDKPVVPYVKLDDVEVHVQVALKWRPELNQTRWQ